MTKPMLMVVDDHVANRDLVRQELLKRYAAEYEIIALATPAAAFTQIEAYSGQREAIALIVAAQHMEAMSGIEFLEHAHKRYAWAKRLLLVPQAVRSASKPILRAITLGQLDRFVKLPSQSPDEQFHHIITQLLLEWQRQHTMPFKMVTLIGQRNDAYAYELRDLLHRSSLPFAFHEADSLEGEQLLQNAGVPSGPFPVLILFSGQVFTKPTLEEMAVALGVRHSREEGIFDLAIIGAGPAGLSAAVYGASEGLRTLVVDRETFGGQAGTTSLIRNYLGFPFGISGAELLSRALDQAWSFGAETSVLRQATDLRAADDHRIITFADGSEITCRAVVLAMGASYQRLGVPSLEELIGSGVFYGGGVTEAQAMQGKHVFVIGAGNSAGQAAVHLAKYAEQVTMLVRSSSLTSTMSDYLIKEIEAADNIEVRYRTVVVDGGGNQQLETLTLENLVSGERETTPASALFILIGAIPRTEWLPTSILRDSKGFILTGTDLASRLEQGVHAGHVRPLLLETSLPGVFAAGDVRYGSVKRVAAAVGEGGTAIQSVHRYLATLTR